MPPTNTRLETSGAESTPPSDVPAKVVARRITHLRDACSFINETIASHRDPEAFRSIVDWAIQNCEVEPVQLAKAFEVSTGTVSRWRAGKNAPHPRERPRIIAWMKDWIANRILELQNGLAPEPEEARIRVPRAARV